MARYIPKNDIHGSNFMRDSKALPSDFEEPNNHKFLNWLGAAGFFCVLLIILFI